MCSRERGGGGRDGAGRGCVLKIWSGGGQKKKKYGSFHPVREGEEVRCFDHGGCGGRLIKDWSMRRYLVGMERGGGMVWAGAADFWQGGGGKKAMTLEGFHQLGEDGSTMRYEGVEKKLNSGRK